MCSRLHRTLIYSKPVKSSMSGCGKSKDGECYRVYWRVCQRRQCVAYVSETGDVSKARDGQINWDATKAVRSCDS